MTVRDIIHSAGAKAIADQGGWPLATVYKWGQRGSIPVRYWAELVAVFRRLDRDLSVEQLAAAHAPEGAEAAE
ncbi:MAG: hypothetical protein Tsb0020_54420 [Haliangiales bacterium]